MPSAAPGSGSAETEQGELRLRLVTWKRDTEEYQAPIRKCEGRVRISQCRVPIRHFRRIQEPGSRSTGIPYSRRRV